MLRNLPKETSLVRGRARIQTQTNLISKPGSGTISSTASLKRKRGTEKQNQGWRLLLFQDFCQGWAQYCREQCCREPRLDIARILGGNAWNKCSMRTLLCHLREGKGYLEGDQKLPFNSCRGPSLSCSPLPNNLISSLWKALSCYGNEYSININRIKSNRILPH